MFARNDSNDKHFYGPHSEYPPGESNNTNEVLITLWWFRSPVYGITIIVLANGSNAQMYGITTLLASYARVINK